MDGQIHSMETYPQGDLVVDFDDLQRLQQQLGYIGLRPILYRHSERLGLVLLRLPDLENVREFLLAVPGLLDQAEKSREQTYLAGQPVPTLDLLLVHIRMTSGTGQDTSPIVGKNRLLGGVEGSPHIGGGEGDPEPLGPGESVRLPARGAVSGPRIRVGLLDTRVYAHPELTGRYLAETDTLLPTRTVQPSTDGHAVFLAGRILTAAPNADLIVKWVLDDEASAADSWDVAEKMMDFRDEDVQVLNCSFGCVTADGQAPLVLARAVQRLGPVAMVAAAGNAGMLSVVPPAGLPVWPAAFKEVIAVGADATFGREAAFSPRQTWVDLLAPGVGIVSTFLPGDVDVIGRSANGDTKHKGIRPFGPQGAARWEGTSFSAAHVSGTIATILEHQKISSRTFVDRLAAGDKGLIKLLEAEQIRPPEYR